MTPRRDNDSLWDVADRAIAQVGSSERAQQVTQAAFELVRTFPIGREFVVADLRAELLENGGMTEADEGRMMGAIIRKLAAEKLVEKTGRWGTAGNKATNYHATTRPIYRRI